MKSEPKNVTTYVLKFVPKSGEDANGPFFSFGKLLHVAQNISSNYAKQFSIKTDSQYIFSEDDIERVEVISIELPDITEETADSLAEDLCAFLKLSKVEIVKNVAEKHIVIETV